jgi:hypothetical protein
MINGFYIILCFFVQNPSFYLYHKLKQFNQLDIGKFRTLEKGIIIITMMRRAKEPLSPTFPM